MSEEKSREITETDFLIFCGGIIGSEFLALVVSPWFLLLFVLNVFVTVLAIRKSVTR